MEFSKYVVFLQIVIQIFKYYFSRILPMQLVMEIGL